MLGKVLHGNIYPPRASLFDKTKHQYIDDGHTQKLNYRGEIYFVPGFILHDDRKPFERWVRNQIQYAKLEAEKLLSGAPLERNDRLRLCLWIAPLAIPWFMFFGKGLWRDGIAGWAYILQRTAAEVLIALAIVEKKFSVGN
jgi:hypothetical protein